MPLDITWDASGGAPKAFAATVGVTATLVLAQKNRRSILFYNFGSVIVYIDTDPAVTTSTGFPIYPGKSFGIYQGDVNTQFSANSAYWGIASSSCDVRGWETV